MKTYYKNSRILVTYVYQRLPAQGRQHETKKEEKKQAFTELYEFLLTNAIAGARESPRGEDEAGSASLQQNSHQL